MFCCCKPRPNIPDIALAITNEQKGPIVTIFGASGYLGKCVIVPFIDALKSGRIPELRIPCRNSSDETIQAFVSQGAKAFQVDFKDKSSLANALNGTYTVISCLGTSSGEETIEMNNALISAMVAAGVKNFFPSEFGTNHYKINPEYNHPIFAAKRTVFQSARERGLSPICILCGNILESSFGKWFGLDCSTEIWSIVGAANVPVAMTSEKDVGRFTLEAALLAYLQPEVMVDKLEVYSCQKTLAEYAEAFDKVAGHPTKLEFMTLTRAKKEYKTTQIFEMVIRILFYEGTYDYTHSTGNQLINPGGERWTLRTFEDYAQETGGRPWKDGTAVSTAAAAAAAGTTATLVAEDVDG